MENMQNVLIGELSKQSGCPIETIRYYERIKLLPSPLRTSGGQRCYQPQEVQKLTFIVQARGLGFSIRDIRELIVLSNDPSSCSGVQKLTEVHLKNIKNKITELQKFQAVLSEVSKRCEQADNPCCPVIEELSKRAV